MKKLFRYTGSWGLIMMLLLFVIKVNGDDSKKKLKVFTTYLGSSDYKGGMIPKPVFDSLIRKGVSARDSAGNNYKVSEFVFSYSERNIYEDSTGKLVIMTDYLSEYCLGDTLSPSFQNFIYRDHRTKHGDTVYLDKVKVMLPEGGTVLAVPSRFILTK